MPHDPAARLGRERMLARTISAAPGPDLDIRPGWSFRHVPKGYAAFGRSAETPFHRQEAGHAS
jgi:hypothetical protein